MGLKYDGEKYNIGDFFVWMRVTPIRVEVTPNQSRAITENKFGPAAM